MVAGDERRPWARLDAGLYMECFTAQALPTPAARDSARGRLAGHMAGPRKRPRETVRAELREQDHAEAGAPVCGKYNCWQVQELARRSTAGQSRLPAEARLICTPLQAEAWQTMLADHPDRQLVDWMTRGIWQGFRVGYQGDPGELR